MKRCPFCNTELTDDSIFCSECGQRVGQPGGSGASYGPSEPGMAGGAGDYGGAFMASQLPPEPPAPKKKTGIVIAGGAAIAAAAAIGVFAGVKLTAKDPKDVVFDAFKSVYSSEITYPAEEVFGWKEMMKRYRKESMEGEFSLTLEQSAEPELNALAGTGFSASCQSDIQQKRIWTQVGTRLANMDFMTMELYLDQEDLAVSVPEVSEKVFTVHYGDDLAGQLERSPVVGVAVKQSGIDTSAVNRSVDYLWSLYDSERETPFDVEALWARYKEGSTAIHDFKEAMEVEKAEGAKYTIDGKEVTCKGYHVVISQKAIVDFAETTSKFLLDDENLQDDVLELMSQVIDLSGASAVGGRSAKELQKEVWSAMEEYADQMLDAVDDSVEDIVMTVYVDKKGRLAAVEAETSLQLGSEEYDVALEAQMKGGSYLTQNSEWEVEIKGEGERAVISVTEEGSYDKDALTKSVEVTVSGGGEKVKASWDAEYDRNSGDYSLELVGKGDDITGSITVDGTISDLQPGKAVDIEMDNLRVKWEGQQLAALSGRYAVRPLEDEVTMPKGEKFDVLAADRMEWQELAREMEQNINMMQRMLNGLSF